MKPRRGSAKADSPIQLFLSNPPMLFRRSTPSARVAAGIAGAVAGPKGVTIYSKSLKKVLQAVFDSHPGQTRMLLNPARTLNFVKTLARGRQSVFPVVRPKRRAGLRRWWALVEARRAIWHRPPKSRRRPGGVLSSIVLSPRVSWYRGRSQFPIN
jgi:hypothetical protein